MFFQKKISYLLVVVLSIISITGCQKKVKNNEVEVLTVNQESVKLDEVLYQVYKTEKENEYYSTKYEEKYNESYWDSEIVEGVLTKDSLKEEVLDTIVRNEILYQKALQEGYELTSEEDIKSRKEAKEELESMSEDEKNVIQASTELISKIKQRDIIVSNYFQNVIDSYKVDEDEIKKSLNPDDNIQYDVETIYFSKIVWEEDGSSTKKTKEENHMGLDGLKEMQPVITQSEDWIELDLDENNLEYEEYSVAADDSNYQKEFLEALKDMKPGETSDIIETEDGYYILRLLRNDDDSMKKDAINQAVLQEKYKKFDRFYEELKSKAEVETTSQWDKIVIGGTVVKSVQ